jgi:hypothetical protein
MICMNNPRIPILLLLFTALTTLACATGYVPITIANNQSIAVTPGFQQMITFNPSNPAYALNESPDLGNLRFYQGSNELYSWCESGCSSSSKSAVFWIYLPNGIAAYGSATINLKFESASTEYDGVYAGEAPQLSPSYAQYDNGNTVFPSFYQDFNGTSCPSAATCGTSQPPIIDNGISLVATTYGDISSIRYYMPSGALPPPGVFDLYGNVLTTGSAGTAYFGTYTATSLGTLSSGSSSPVGVYDSATGGCLMGSTSARFSSTPPEGYNVYSLEMGIPSGGYFSEIGQYDYNSTTQATLGNCPIKTSYYLMALSQNGGSIQAYWMRVRAYPPNGVMPSLSFGSVAPLPVAVTDSFTEIGLPRGANFTVTFDNQTKSMSTTAGWATLYFSTYAGTGGSYTAYNSVYGGVTYIPSVRGSDIKPGSRAEIFYRPLPQPHRRR